MCGTSAPESGGVPWMRECASTSAGRRAPEDPPLAKRDRKGQLDREQLSVAKRAAPQCLPLSRVVAPAAGAHPGRSAPSRVGRGCGLLEGKRDLVASASCSQTGAVAWTSVSELDPVW
eukprot:scaffold873_cov393-Prasinococcus_capsulatus_cf.AAC.24